MLTDGRRTAVLLGLLLLWGCAGPERRSVRTGTSTAGDGVRLHADPGVRVERPGQGTIPYRKGMALQIGDVIETAGGYAVIVFDRGNVVDLRPGTRIALGSIRLFVGELFARIAEIVAHGGGEVLTDELAASVEGTEYAVRRAASDSGGATDVIVRAGTVRCTPVAGATWPQVSLGANRVFRVANGRAVGPPGPIDAAAETRWADDVERRLLGGRRPVFGPSIRWPRGPRWRPPRPQPPPSRPPSGPG
jgi:hypothetical protein